MKRLVHIIEVDVLVQGGLRVGRDPVQVDIFEQRGVHRKLRVLFWRDAGVLEQFQAKGGHRRQAFLHLRQGQQRDVHGVVAVQVGIQDQVRRVAGVGDHGAHIADQVRVLGLAHAGGGAVAFALQLLPFLPHRRQPHMFAFAFAQSVFGELQSHAQLAVQDFEQGKGLVDLALRFGQRAADGAVASPGTGDQRLVLREPLQ